MHISASRFAPTVPVLESLASGLALFAVLTVVVGFLAAIAIPPGYFAYFGRDHIGLALLLSNTVIVAVPIAAVGFLWCSITMRLVRLPAVSAAVLCLVGYLIGLVYSYVEAIAGFLALQVEGKVPLSVFLLSGLTWWNAPLFLAVPLGIVSAATLEARSLRPAR